MKKKFVLFALLVLGSCSKDASFESFTVGRMSFVVSVLDNPYDLPTKAGAINNNTDFKVNDAFGFFVVDAMGNTLEGYKNLRVSTPDGKTWESIDGIKFGTGLRYYAYAPYDESFTDCANVEAIEAKMTAPSADQSTKAAIDWKSTGLVSPGNGQTELNFRHKYGRIDIYDNFSNDHIRNWPAYQYFVKDESGVSHYSYILNQDTPLTIQLAGSYSVGNSKVGMREVSYSSGNITIGNGYHITVNTSKTGDECYVDLGLPSGTKWARFNLGADVVPQMNDSQIAAAEKCVGSMMAWGEIWPKPAYSNNTYVDAGNTLMPDTISGTEWDAARQIWGGYWQMPSEKDFDELMANVTFAGSQSVSVNVPAFDGTISQVTKDIYTFKSKINDETISFIAGYSYSSGTKLSSSVNSTVYAAKENNLVKASLARSNAYLIRPVWKHTASVDDILDQIDGIDLGCRETIDGRVYKVLFAPMNVGAENSIATFSYDHLITESEQLEYGLETGWRLAWGQTSLPEKYYTESNYNQYYRPKEGSTILTSIINHDTYDAAKVNWKRGWRLMSKDHIQWICNNCTATKTTVKGVTVMKLTSKVDGFAGKYIYLRCTGHITAKESDISYYEKTNYDNGFYPSGDASTESAIYMLQITKDDGTFKYNTKGSKHSGLLVRPVKLVPLN